VFNIATNPWSGTFRMTDGLSVRFMGEAKACALRKPASRHDDVCNRVITIHQPGARAHAAA